MCANIPQKMSILAVKFYFTNSFHIIFHDVLAERKRKCFFLVRIFDDTLSTSATLLGCRYKTSDSEE